MRKWCLVRGSSAEIRGAHAQAHPVGVPPGFQCVSLQPLDKNCSASFTKGFWDDGEMVINAKAKGTAKGGGIAGRVTDRAGEPLSDIKTCTFCSYK